MEICLTTGKDKFLSWIQRLEIAVDSARGLQFLHSYSEGCIVHRDIKVCLKNLILVLVHHHAVSPIIVTSMVFSFF